MRPGSHVRTLLSPVQYYGVVLAAPATRAPASDSEASAAEPEKVARPITVFHVDTPSRTLNRMAENTGMTATSLHEQSVACNATFGKARDSAISFSGTYATTDILSSVKFYCEHSKWRCSNFQIGRAHV